MSHAKHGNTVQIHYTGTLDDGFVFDSSRERDPLEFKIGDGFVLEGFEQAVIGMNPGESKTIKLNPTQAYGEVRPELIMAVARSQFPDDIAPEIGQQIKINDKQLAEPLIVTITSVTDTEVTLDANHPLAGKDLTFDIELVAING